MLNIHSVLKFILLGLEDAVERFKIVDDEHVIDSHTGVELHLYDGWFKLTRGDDVIIEMINFSEDEKQVLWDIKTIITEPATMKEREDNYISNTQKRRQKLSDLFENPQPLKVKSPVMETGTVDYTG